MVAPNISHDDLQKVLLQLDQAIYNHRKSRRWSNKSLFLLLAPALNGLM